MGPRQECMPLRVSDAQRDQDSCDGVDATKDQATSSSALPSRNTARNPPTLGSALEASPAKASAPWTEPAPCSRTLPCSWARLAWAQMMTLSVVHIAFAALGARGPRELTVVPNAVLPRG